MTESIAAPPHVVAFRFSGEPDPRASETVLTALDAAAQQHDDVALYVEIGWGHGLTPKGFAESIRLGLARLGAQTRVRRLAIVSGDYQHRTVARQARAVASGVQVEAFPTGSRAAALDWAAEGGTPRAYVA